MAKNDNGIDLASNGDYWQAVWYDNNGKRQRKGIGHKKKVSKRQARQLMIALAEKMAIDPRTREKQTNVSLSAYRTRYIEVMGTELKPTTITLHETTLEYLAEYFSYDPAIQSITKAQATDWHTWIQKKPGLKKDSSMALSTVRRHVRTAKTIFNLAVREDTLTRNPFQHLEGTTPNIDKDWADLITQDIQALIDAAATPAWKALIGLCAHAGLRIGEALRLTWQDIQWADNRLVVKHEGNTTTKGRRREVLMEPALAAILLDAQEHTDSLLVFNATHYNLQRDMHALVKRAGLPLYHKPFHTLRKWRATTWSAKHPEYIADSWLGHGPEVARKHYKKVPASYYKQSDSPTESEQIETLRAEVAELKVENQRLKSELLKT